MKSEKLKTGQVSESGGNTSPAADRRAAMGQVAHFLTEEYLCPPADHSPSRSRFFSGSHRSSPPMTINRKTATAVPIATSG